MKKNLLIVLCSVMVVAGATVAFAAGSATLSPMTVSVTSGQSFTLTSSMNPGGVKGYTAKLEVSYPVDLLEVTSFSQSSGWMPLSQPGYDLVDNVAGKLVKTAGYAGGWVDTKQFGTVTFRAKKTGAGQIFASTGTVIYDAANQNVIAGGLPEVSVTVNAPVAAPVVTKPVVAPTTTQTTVVSPVATSSEDTLTASVSTAAASSTIGFGEAMEVVLSLGTGSPIISVIVSLLLLGIVSFAVRAVVKR